MTVNGGGFIGGAGNSGTVGVLNNLNLTISGATTFFFVNGTIGAGVTTIDPGATLQIGTADTTGFGGPNNIVDNGTLIFGAPLTEGFSNISGAGQVIVRNGNTLNLFTSNSYSGGTTIDSGGEVPFGRGPPGGGDVQVDGTLDILGTDITVGALTGGGIVTNGAGAGTATVTVTESGTFSGVIKDGATAKTALTIDGTGITQSLTGANTYTGVTTVSSGTLRVTGSLSNSASEVDLTGANVVLDGNGTGQVLRPVVITGAGVQVTDITVNTMSAALDGIAISTGASNVTINTVTVTGSKKGINANGV